MSNYDLIAISSKPDLFISSSAIGDQSGVNLYPVVISAPNSGQPIIAGNPSSYLVSDTTTIVIDNNPILLRPGSSLEFVLYLPTPSTSMMIFGDTSGENGIYLNTTGIDFRFTDGADVVSHMSIPVQDWNRKFYVLISFDNEAATFQVNEVQKSVSYVARDPSLVGQLKFSSATGYQYAIDGIGAYSHNFTKKDNLIDTSVFGYPTHISTWYNAISTNLIGQHIDETYLIARQSFVKSLANKDVFTQMFAPGFEYGFISIEADTQNAITYQVNEGAERTFTKRAIVTSSDAAQYIRFIIDSSTPDFTITLKVYAAGVIDILGPAQLTLNGGAFYPQVSDLSLVNCPQGVSLRGGYLSGEWLSEQVPRSVEIIFRPSDTSTTHVFASADGNATYGTSGSLTGYKAWLNGQLATNLNKVLVNQWNHLVLTTSNPTSSTFNLNATALGNSAGNIEYLFLAAYPIELQLVPEMYAMVSSSYKMAHIETSALTIHEGEGDPGSPFSLYSFAWAIVGGGGV